MQKSIKKNKIALIITAIVLFVLAVIAAVCAHNSQIAITKSYVQTPLAKNSINNTKKSLNELDTTNGSILLTNGPTKRYIIYNKDCLQISNQNWKLNPDTYADAESIYTKSVVKHNIIWHKQSTKKEATYLLSGCPEISKQVINITKANLAGSKLRVYPKTKHGQIVITDSAKLCKQMQYLIASFEPHANLRISRANGYVDLINNKHKITVGKITYNFVIINSDDDLQKGSIQISCLGQRKVLSIPKHITKKAEAK